MTKVKRITELLLFILIATILMFVVTACNKVSEYDLSDSQSTFAVDFEGSGIYYEVEQTDENTKASLNFSSSKNLQSVEVSVKTTNGVEKSKKTVELKDEKSFETTVDLNYGKNIVEVKAVINNNSLVLRKSFSRTADEYVVAPLVATMPVTMFSLELKEITNNYTIPTFVWLQRGGAWDYSNMPENVHIIPFADESKASEYNDPGYMYIETSKWIKELYTLNNNSKFHIYCNDYHPNGWMLATYANNLPKQNYDVTLLTDGTASDYAFKTWTTGENAKTYEELAQIYNVTKTQLAQRGTYSFGNEGLKYNFEDTRNYIIAMLKEDDNVKLQLTRAWSVSSATDPNIATIYKELVQDGKITVYNLYNNLLKPLSEEEQTAIKSLYKFSDAMFEDAVSQNKKVMLIMGTRTANEVDFEDYVNATKAYYGDDYVYYYKGHPGTPTISDPDKANMLKNIGLIDVDSTISAELIFFFNSEICGTGYTSTTFESLPEEQIGGIFDKQLSGVSSVYQDKVDFAIHKVSSNDEKYGSIISGTAYVLEFNNTTDIGVYANNTITYYSFDGNSYVAK